jgi:hypothetical protein
MVDAYVNALDSLVAADAALVAALVADVEAADA